MPRKTKYAGQGLDTVEGRVEFVLRELYHGEQSVMSVKTGISQPQISLVVQGKRRAGPKLLAALARVPRLNSQWLRYGVGEPFVSPGLPVVPEQAPAWPQKEISEPVVRPSTESHTTDLGLPVYQHLLTGLEQESLGVNAGMRLRIEGLISPTMYAYEVQDHDTITYILRLRALPGDLLMMETDCSLWMENPQILSERVCVVRGGDDAARTLLAKAVWDLEPHLIQLFPLDDISLVEEALEFFDYVKEHYEVNFQLPRRIRIKDHDKEDIIMSKLLGLSSVIAFCAFMIRRRS